MFEDFFHFIKVECYQEFASGLRNFQSATVLFYDAVMRFSTFDIYMYLRVYVAV